MEIHRSARKHGVDDPSIEHAIANCLVVVSLDPDSDPPRVLAIGPDFGGNLLEVIWLELDDDSGCDPCHGTSARVLRPAARPRGRYMTESKTYRTKSGRLLDDNDLDSISDEVESATYDVEALKSRRRGRPTMGSGPADVVPVRLEPELRDALQARANAENTTASDVIRRALKDFLHVA